MSNAWYYSHDGAIHGPFSAEEIQDRAARKMLLETDWVWEGIGERKHAVPAKVVLEFPPLLSKVSPIPDWVADVAKVETKGPLPGLVPSDEIPDWLEDLRLWVGLDMYMPTGQTSKDIAEVPPSNPAQSGGIPDWLENWTTPERPKRPDQVEVAPSPCDKHATSSQPVQAANPPSVSQVPPAATPPVSSPSQAAISPAQPVAAQKPFATKTEPPASPLAQPTIPSVLAVEKQASSPSKTAPPVSPPAQPTITPALAIATQELCPTKTEPPASLSAQPTIPPVLAVAAQEPFPAKTEPPAQPTIPPAMAVEKQASPPTKTAPPIVSSASIAPKPSIVGPTQPSTRNIPSAALGTKSLADKILEMSGFDMETGQILDAEKFRKWKQQQAHTTSANQPVVSNASLFEVFRKARTAIEAWIDDDANRVYMMHAELDELIGKPEIQAILQKYGGYGKDMREKLVHHLGFVVQNRRKYYKALEHQLSS